MSLLLLESGDAILTEDDAGRLLLETGTMADVWILALDEIDIQPAEIHEETNIWLQGYLIDQSLAAVPLADIEAAQVRVFDRSTETILRPAEDALNAGDVTIEEVDGRTVVTFSGNLRDTRLVSLGNTQETHVILFEFTGDYDVAGTETDPISTTSGSSVVTLTLTGHGLSATTFHQLFLEVEEEVGGLLLQGSFRVLSIEDDDTVTIDGRCPATSTATGGGTVNWWADGKIGKAVATFQVKRAEPVCPS